MDTDKIVPVDIKDKRKAAKLTQSDVAKLFGVERETIVRAENDSLSFPLAIEYTRLFGSITLRKGEDTFVLSLANGRLGPDDDPDHIPDDEELHDLNDTEHNLNVLNQAADVVQVMQRLTSSPLLLRSDSELSDALRIAKYKELFELDWAVRGRIREGAQLHPHLVDEGLRRALAERPGAQGRESDEQVA